MAPGSNKYRTLFFKFVASRKIGQGSRNAALSNLDIGLITEYLTSLNNVYCAYSFLFCKFPFFFVVSLCWVNSLPNPADFLQEYFYFILITTLPFARPVSTYAIASLVCSNGNTLSITGFMMPASISEAIWLN